MKIGKIGKEDIDLDFWHSFWFVFGIAFEDENGNRIDPRNVVYNPSKNKFELAGDLLK